MKPSPPTEEPIGLLAAAVRRGVRQLVERRVGALGLSSQQFWMLVNIVERPGRSQAELAAHQRIDEATACRVTRALSSRGLVEALRDTSDRRRVQVALTPAGDRLARRLLPIAATIRSAVDGALTPDERAATRAALVKVISHLARLSGPEGVAAAPSDGDDAAAQTPRRRPGRARRRPPTRPGLA